MLKPGGALAAWCYYHPEIKGQPEASRVHAEFCSSVLGPYKEEAHSACERQYAGLEPSSAEFGVVERASLQFEQQSSIMHLVGIFCSTTALSITRTTEHMGKSHAPGGFCCAGAAPGDSRHVPEDAQGQPRGARPAGRAPDTAPVSPGHG